MNVHIANYNPDKIGGGWTQSKYLYEKFDADYDEADIYLVTGASMASYDDINRAKEDGKKVVLRVDNHLLPSRNRNTGMSRMKAFAKESDLLIYQSQWARKYLRGILGKDGGVVLNGTDMKLFNPNNRINTNDCLYVRSSRISEKGWEMSRYWYSRHYKSPKYGGLFILGKFSNENIQYNFDFIGQEPYQFLGEQPHEILPNIMKRAGYFLYSYFMDACSNTLIEAIASGCKIIDVYGMLQTGGAPEIIKCEDLSKERMVREYEELLSVL